MSSSNLIPAESDTNKVLNIGIAKAAAEFNTLLSKIHNSRWDERVYLIASFSELPISECLFDSKLKPLQHTIPAELGHNTFLEFVTRPNEEKGLNIELLEWRTHVQALCAKIEFGIVTNDPEDVFLQLEDITNKLGRKPVSSSEFNIAKEQILAEQINKLKSEHNKTVSEMKTRFGDLMSELDAERRAKFEAIELHEQLLCEVKNTHGLLGRSDLSKYVEIDIYNGIVEELEALKTEHAKTIDFYSEKIASLTLISDRQKKELGALRQQLSGLFDNLKSQSDSRVVDDLKEEILALKKKIIRLLKSNMQRQNIMNKQKLASKKKSELLQIAKSNQLSQSINTLRKSNKSMKVITFIALLFGITSTMSTISTYYM